MQRPGSYLSTCAKKGIQATPQRYNDRLQNEIEAAFYGLGKEICKDDRRFLAQTLVVHDRSQYETCMKLISQIVPGADPELTIASQMLFELPSQPWHGMRARQLAIIKTLDALDQNVDYDLAERVYLALRQPEKRAYVQASNSLFNVLDVLVEGDFPAAAKGYDDACVLLNDKGVEDLLVVTGKALLTAMHARAHIVGTPYGPADVDLPESDNDFEAQIYREVFEVYRPVTPNRSSCRTVAPAVERA